MQITLRQLEVFRALMRSRTVIGAAQELRIAQPTVTKTIRRIEDICAIPLFDRHGGRLVPTAEAHRLLSEVDLAFEQLEGAIARSLRLAHADGGSLRIGSSPSTGRVLAPQAAAELIAQHPGLSLQIDILSVAQVTEYLLSGQGECVITLFPILHAGVRSTPIGTAPAMVVAPRGWLPAFTSTLDPSHLPDRPLIVFEPQSVHGRAVEAVLAASQLKPRQTHVARFAETAIGMAEAGLGLAIVDAFSSLSADRDKVEVARLDHPHRYEVFLHRQMGRASSRLIKTLEAALTKRAAVIVAQL